MTQVLSSNPTAATINKHNKGKIIVIGGGFIAAVINAFIGAVILLLILRLVKRAV